MSALLKASELVVRYQPPHGRLRRGLAAPITALQGVSIALQARSIVGVVGESGAGKSTLAKVLAGLIPPSSGSIHFHGMPIGYPRDRRLSRAIQIVFQDPGSSLNPALSVGRVLSELLRFHELVPSALVAKRCRELLELVHLPAQTLGAKPRELSGGERQRVAIARALAVAPEVLIADEVTSALDVSVQAAILALFAELRAELGIAILLVSHDLPVIRATCESVAVMNAGQIVETGSTGQVFSRPAHRYTRALLKAVPRAGQPVPEGDRVIERSAGEPA